MSNKIHSFKGAIDFFLEGLARQDAQLLPSKQTLDPESKLRRTRGILSLLDNPQDSLKIVHVAGSKGKGSVSAYISSVLSANSLKTGTFLSPHASTWQERWLISGKMAEKRLITQAAEEVRKAASTYCSNHPDRPTTFELIFATALVLFRDAGCTWAVIETGIGGRLDSTNVVSPQVSVITTIEKEHTAILGNTIPEIALEKAGIIKPGVPIVVGPKVIGEALATIEEAAKSSSSPLIKVTMEGISRHGIEQATLPSLGRDSQPREVMEISMPNNHWASSTRINLKMLGSVQCENVATAITTLKCLGQFSGKSEQISAIENTTLPARFEKRGRIVYDAAHTPTSLDNACKTFKSVFANCSNATLVFTSAKDKNILAMAKVAREIGCFKRVIVTKIPSYKKCDPEEIAGAFREAGFVNVSIVIDYKAALKAASLSGGPVLVSGSFYIYPW